MRCLSINLWFDDRQRDERLEKIIDEIKRVDPLIVCVQELHRSSIEIFDEKMQHYGYSSFTQHLESVKKTIYGCAIYVKNTIIDTISNASYVAFEKTFMMRGFCLIEIDDTIIISTHLESTQSPQIKLIREQQLQQLMHYLESKKKVIIGMDSNTRGQLIGLPPNVVDVIYPLGVKTWFASRYFDFNAEECFDRMLIKGFEVNTAWTTLCEYSDHDFVVVDVE